MPYYKGMSEFAGEAYKIGKETFKTGLDIIDKYIIPVANMLVEWKKYEESVEWLLLGIRACEETPDTISYARKKMDLLSYMLDVYYEADDIRKCREIVEQIEALNVQNDKYGISVEISNKIRDAIR